MNLSLGLLAEIYIGQVMYEYNCYAQDCFVAKKSDIWRPFGTIITKIKDTFDTITFLLFDNAIEY
jgi:hypothetical protein